MKLLITYQAKNKKNSQQQYNTQRIDNLSNYLINFEKSMMKTRIIIIIN